MNKTVSIVMAYYNRKPQLLNTLASIRHFGHEVEVVIVDDASNDGDDIYALESGSIKVVRIVDKTWINPCIAFNMGFVNATGDVIIIQNPECIHVGDIVGHVLDNIKDGLYLNYSAYSINKSITERIIAGEDVVSAINPIENRIVPTNMENGWYNHPVYRPYMLHFCSAITRKDLWELGGFDERYFDGLAFDDNDFLHRLNMKKMKITMIENPFVVHQWHNVHFEGDVVGLMTKNGERFAETRQSKEYDVKPYNKIFK